MRRLLAAMLITLAVVTLVGWIRGDQRDRMRLSAVVDKSLITVVVTMPDVSEQYRWLSVYGCSAEMTESGVYCLPDGWETQSTQQIDGLKQVLLPWRRVPPGMVRVTAMAFDQQQQVLAAGSLTIFRGE